MPTSASVFYFVTFNSAMKQFSYTIGSLLLGLLIFVSSCKKEDDPPYLTLTPGSAELSVPPGGVIEFRVRAYAGDNELRNLVITEKPLNSITTTIYDESLYGETADFYYVYTVPTAGIEQVLLRFTIYDQAGKSNAAPVLINIEGNAFLEQSTGHQLNSIFNTSNDGFDISEVEILSLDVPGTDSTLADIFEFDLDEGDENLSRSWTSYSGIKFVRNNDFNYAEATNASASNTFNSSSQQEIISNIAENDIIITRFDTINDRYAVIRVTGVFDGEGIDNDRYEFNLKK